MDLYSNLVEAEQRLVALVSSIEADSYSSPTPCDRWDVRALLSHALASIDAFAAAVDGAPGPDMAQVFSGADIVGDDPLGATQRITRRSQAAWSTVRDLNAELSTFIGVMPAGQALAIITFSTVVHGWDLAVATGQAGELPEHLAEAAQQVAAELVPVLASAGPVRTRRRPSGGSHAHSAARRPYRTETAVSCVWLSRSIILAA
ncbi:hypothetical protein MRGA327_10700 [Mycobacterium tuberculosis RGTB327]|nr:hypothetical protein MRGA327_10700 [Mycobacterium tuberculosis RGTB327]